MDTEEYLLQHSIPESELLKELTRETWTTRMNPRMLSGHIQGRFLAFVSSLVKPISILEIGTFTGYSAICLAEGLQPGGILHTIDKDDEVQEVATRYFEKAGIIRQIRMYSGDAREIIPAIPGWFDLVFIDGEKKEYSEYFDAVFPKVRTGGVILADNVLWGGKVGKKAVSGDHATRGIQEFNTKVQQDSRIAQFILPFRDGMNVIIKK